MFELLIALFLLLVVATLTAVLIKVLTATSQDVSTGKVVEETPPPILLGDYVDPNTGELWPLTIDPDPLRTHALISGQTQMGKSREAAGLVLQKLLGQAEQVVVIDPHATIVNFILQTLVSEGMFERDPALKDTILFYDLPEATETHKVYPAFDILSQLIPPHIVADEVLETMHRVWTELDRAPAFDRNVLYGSYVLAQNRLPITLLDEVLEDDVLLSNLAKNVQDRKIRAFYQKRFSKLGHYRKHDDIASTIRRIMRLSFAPELRYSLENRLDDDNPYNLANIRQMLASGKSVLINLHFTSPR